MTLEVQNGMVQTREQHCLPVAERTWRPRKIGHRKPIHQGEHPGDGGEVDGSAGRSAR